MSRNDATGRSWGRTLQFDEPRTQEATCAPRFALAFRPLIHAFVPFPRSDYHLASSCRIVRVTPLLINRLDLFLAGVREAGEDGIREDDAELQSLVNPNVASQVETAGQLNRLDSR